jgi:glycosyltransferase involved in cell wall biosynthesis
LTDGEVLAGTERHILTLVRALREQGVQVRVSAPPRSPLSEAVRLTGSVPWSIPKRGLVDPLAVLKLARWLRRRRIDVIHAHNGRVALNAVIARGLARRGAVVMTQHFIEPSHATRSGLKGRPSARMHRWMNRRIDRFIAISTAVAEAMRSRGDCEDARLSIVPNGIDRPERGQLRATSEVRQGLNVPGDAAGDRALGQRAVSDRRRGRAAPGPAPADSGPWLEPARAIAGLPPGRATVDGGGGSGGAAGEG